MTNKPAGRLPAPQGRRRWRRPMLRWLRLTCLQRNRRRSRHRRPYRPLNPSVEAVKAPQAKPLEPVLTKSNTAPPAPALPPKPQATVTAQPKPALPAALKQPATPATPATSRVATGSGQRHIQCGQHGARAHPPLARRPSSLRFPPRHSRKLPRPFRRVSLVQPSGWGHWLWRSSLRYSPCCGSAGRRPRRRAA